MNPMDEFGQAGGAPAMGPVVPGVMGAGVAPVGGAVPGLTPFPPVGVPPVMPGGPAMIPGMAPGMPVEAGFEEEEEEEFDGDGEFPADEEDEFEGDPQEFLDEAADELGLQVPNEIEEMSLDDQVVWMAQQTAQQAVQDAVVQTVGPLQQQLAMEQARNQALANATHASSVIALHAGVPDAAPQLQAIFSQAAMVGIDPVIAMHTPWFAELVMGYVNGHKVQSVAEGLKKKSEPLPVAAHVGGGLPAEAERPEYAAWDRAMSRQFKDVLGMDLSRMAEREVRRGASPWKGQI